MNHYKSQNCLREAQLADTGRKPMIIPVRFEEKFAAKEDDVLCLNIFEYGNI